MVLSLANLSIIGLAIVSGFCYLAGMAILYFAEISPLSSLATAMKIFVNLVNPTLTLFWFTTTAYRGDKED